MRHRISEMPYNVSLSWSWFKELITEHGWLYKGQIYRLKMFAFTAFDTSMQFKQSFFIITTPSNTASARE